MSRLGGLPVNEKLVAHLEGVYKHLHANPELSSHEHATGRFVADELKKLKIQVHEKIGDTGVVGIMENGKGPVVLMRADLDALPILEKSGLSYASKATVAGPGGEMLPVSHACGHDMHMTWLLGAAHMMNDNKDAWKGTAIFLFQPAEELGRGAKAMIDGGLLHLVPKPVVALSQHTYPNRAGSILYRSGPLMYAADSLLVRFYGKGAHGSQPHKSVDPVAMAAYAVVRLQSIVGREIDPMTPAVVSVGSLQAGSQENIIPDEATLKINLRSTSQAVREQLLEAVKRVCIAEAQASSAPRPPEFTVISNFPPTINDKGVVDKVYASWLTDFDESDINQFDDTFASEDFANFGMTWHIPYQLWLTGVTNPVTYDQAESRNKLAELPGCHSPFYAPDLSASLVPGIKAMLSAASAYVGLEESQG